MGVEGVIQGPALTTGVDADPTGQDSQLPGRTTWTWSPEAPLVSGMMAFQMRTERIGGTGRAFRDDGFLEACVPPEAFVRPSPWIRPQPHGSR